MNFTIHTTETAPETSVPLLEATRKVFGMLPNLHGVLAEAPSALQAYNHLHACFLSTGLDNDEKTVVWQTINVESQCHYCCVPAHTAVANMMGVDAAISTALRDQRALPTKKLEVLRDTTLALLRSRGRLTEQQFQQFSAAGYDKKQLLEILVGMAQKLLSNYTNLLAQTPVDPP